MEARAEPNLRAARLDKMVVAEIPRQVHFIRVETVQHGLALEEVAAIMAAAVEVLESQLVAVEAAAPL